MISRHLSGTFHVSPIETGDNTRYGFYVDGVDSSLDTNAGGKVVGNRLLVISDDFGSGRIVRVAWGSGDELILSPELCDAIAAVREYQKRNTR